MAFDRDAAARAIRSFLVAIGQDPAENSALRSTPERVAEAFEKDLLAGYGVDVDGLLVEESEPLGTDGPRGVVVVRDVAVATMCPHHLLPGLGRATIAYLPGERLVGIGTIARVVDAFSRRLTLQEAIGDQVVRALLGAARARGAACRIELVHSCLASRGARQSDATVVTIAKAGAPIDDALLGSRA
ncbi:MAG TPA: GTP cyclohydrolase I [Polyangiaceae bacterium]|nr:GTP cyclohydrolase I [Polyangiaceae bacterium]